MIRSLLLLSFIGVLVFSACNFTQKIKDGKMAYDRKQYAVAVSFLTKEYAKSKSRTDKGKIAFRLGQSYKFMNQDAQCAQWFKIAYDNQYVLDALKEYAFSLKRSEQYAEAMEAFKNLGLEIGSPYEYRREITACQQAAQWKKNAANSGLSVEPLPLNTSDNEFAPAFYKENQLVFTSDRGASTGKDSYHWTGNKFFDLFVSDVSGGSASSFDPYINTALNEGTAIFNSECTEIIFSRCGGEKGMDQYCQLMSAQKLNEGWSKPEALPFCKNNINYGHPALSKDGGQLFFAAEDPNGWGGKDIYVSDRSPQGWDEPRLLSRTINTPGNEAFPVVDEDTLYFSSDYLAGMGGYDIFKSYKLPDGNWSPAQNMKPPINSGGDDFGFLPDRKNPPKEGVLQMGYFASNRSGGSGGDDMYRFEKRIPPPAPVVDTPVVQQPYKMLLDVYVLEKIFADPSNPNSAVLGRKTLPGSKVDVKFGKQTKSYNIDEEGKFTLQLDEKTDYAFFGSHDGYLNKEASFTTKGIGKDPANPVQTFELEILLDKIYINKEIVLENIYYDFDKWNIRDDAKPTLDQLVLTLKQNPGIRIRLASHTDCRGNDQYNEELSQRRAESAVAYLISKGIEANRLEAKGFGENVPEVPCACAKCTEEEHQKNRRTSFTVIGE